MRYIVDAHETGNNNNAEEMGKYLFTIHTHTHKYIPRPTCIQIMSKHPAAARTSHRIWLRVLRAKIESNTFAETIYSFHSSSPKKQKQKRNCEREKDWQARNEPKICSN